MTDYYVRSTDGNDSDSGLTWALAKATLAGAASIASPGDRIFLSQNHSEVITHSVTTTLTVPHSSLVACVDDTSGEPPTAYATGAVIEVRNTAASGFITFTIAPSTNTPNRGFTMRGVRLKASKNASGVTAYAYVKSSENVDCTFGEQGAGPFYAGFSFDLLGNELLNKKNNCHQVTGDYLLVGTGSKVVSGTTDQVAWTINGPAYGIDLSALTNLTALFQNTTEGTRIVELPSAFTGAYASFTSNYGNSGWLYGLGSIDAWQVDTAQGVVRGDTGIYRVGGAESPENPYSMRFITNDNTQATHELWWRSGLSLGASPIMVWSDGTSQKTVTVEIAHNAIGSGTSGAVTDEEAYLVVAYPDHATKQTYDLATDARDWLASSASDQASSSETWANAAGYVKQKLSVTFTPARSGWLFIFPVLTVPNATMYVDGMATVS